MSRHDQHTYLEHIRAALERIADYTADGKDVFLASTLQQDAVLRKCRFFTRSCSSCFSVRERDAVSTDADRAHVVESLAHADEAGSSPRELAELLRRLGPRWFLVRDVHSSTKLVLLKPRWALSYLRGPMTQSELRRAIGRGRRRVGEGTASSGLTEVAARGPARAAKALSLLVNDARGVCST